MLEERREEVWGETRDNVIQRGRIIRKKDRHVVGCWKGRRGEKKCKTGQKTMRYRERGLQKEI